MSHSTLDITKQRMRLTDYPGPGGASSEAWFQDLFARFLKVAGFEDILFDPEPPEVILNPENIKRIWFDRGNPPTGSPGIFKIWDGDVQRWVPLTPAGWKMFRGDRRRHTSGPTPHTDATLWDTWLCDETGPAPGHFFVFTETSPGVLSWLDISG